MFMNPREHEVSPLVSDLLLGARGLSLRESYNEGDPSLLPARSCKLEQCCRRFSCYTDLL